MLSKATAKKRRRHRCRFNIPTCPGCTPDQDAKEAERRLFFSHIMVFGAQAMISGLDSSPGNRLQLQSCFFEAHCPVELKGRAFVYDKLLDWFSQENPAMKAATEGLLLRQAAESNNDANLIVESRKCYGRAVRLLGEGIRSPTTAKDPGLVYAVDALYTYSMYAQSSTDALLDWQQHTRGLGALVQAHGIDIFEQPTHVGAMFMDHLHANVMEAIISRKELVFGWPEWIAKMSMQKPRRLLRLVLHACRIPAQLEVIDTCTRLPRRSERRSIMATRAFKALGSILGDFESWLLEWYQSLPERPVYFLCDLDAFHDTVSPMVRSQFQRDHDLYCFSSLLEAIGHVYYWSLLLILRKALYEVASLLQPKFEAQLKRLWDSANDCALSIIRSAPYLISHLGNTLTGNMTFCGPLLWADSWFTANGDGSDGDESSQCRALYEMYAGSRSEAELVCLSRAMAAWLEISL